MKRARSAITGKFVTKLFARRHPDTTVEESVKPGPAWPSDEYVAERIAELLFDRHYGHYWEYQSAEGRQEYLSIAYQAIESSDRLSGGPLAGST